MITNATVELFRVYPTANAKPLATSFVAKDGTFAFNNVVEWSHYYVRAYGAAPGASVSTYTLVGPIVAPNTDATTYAIKLRPVVLEILQEKDPGAATLLQWASAHLYDPTTGSPITNATVTLNANGTNVPMPYGQNLGGDMSFFATVPTGTQGGTSFTITTMASAIGASPQTWNLTGAPLTFDATLTSPTDGTTIATNTALTVAWPAEPTTSYTSAELFQQVGGNFESIYQTDPIDPGMTSIVIPQTQFSIAGSYLLNVLFTTPTCPVTADGCVYNASTAIAQLTVGTN
jgi:hypothetical protein